MTWTVFSDDRHVAGPLGLEAWRPHNLAKVVFTAGILFTFGVVFTAAAFLFVALPQAA